VRRAHINTLPLRTPEGIVFALPLAGPVSRLLAWSVDIACIFAATSVLGRLLNSLGFINREFAQAFLILSYFGISIGAIMHKFELLRRATETVLPRRFCMAYPRCAWVGSQSQRPISVLVTLAGNFCLNLEIRPVERHFGLVLDHDMIGTSAFDGGFRRPTLPGGAYADVVCLY